MVILIWVLIIPMKQKLLSKPMVTLEENVHSDHRAKEQLIKHDFALFVLVFVIFPNLSSIPLPGYAHLLIPEKSS